MAKLDTYTITLNVGTSADNASLTLSVLFEDGDNIPQVIEDLTEKIRVEGIRMKDTKFLNDIKQ